MDGIDTDEVVYITTLVEKNCPVCRSQRIGGSNWDGSVNHMLKTHGWKLLHVGSDWSDDYAGKTISHTVAVLARQ
ncbi:MAG: hypothetical protein JO006_16910 [Paucibacter sp.]|nr:hypothetical protein [Roseateles sp.]